MKSHGEIVDLTSAKRNVALAATQFIENEVGKRSSLNRTGFHFE